MSDNCMIFGFGFACGVYRVPVRRARPRSIDVEFDQPKPAQPHSPTIGPPFTPGGLSSAMGPRNGTRERAGRAFLYDPETGSYRSGK